jgi:hypothetical protein
LNYYYYYFIKLSNYQIITMLSTIFKSLPSTLLIITFTSTFTSKSIPSTNAFQINIPSISSTQLFYTTGVTSTALVDHPDIDIGNININAINLTHKEKNGEVVNTVLFSRSTLLVPPPPPSPQLEGIGQVQQQHDMEYRPVSSTLVSSTTIASTVLSPPVVTEVATEAATEVAAVTQSVPEIVEVAPFVPSAVESVVESDVQVMDAPVTPAQPTQPQHVDHEQPPPKMEVKVPDTKVTSSPVIVEVPSQPQPIKAQEQQVVPSTIPKPKPFSSSSSSKPRTHFPTPSSSTSSTPFLFLPNNKPLSYFEKEVEELAQRNVEQMVEKIVEDDAEKFAISSVRNLEYVDFDNYVGEKGSVVSTSSLNVGGEGEDERSGGGVATSSSSYHYESSTSTFFV